MLRVIENLVGEAGLDHVERRITISRSASKRAMARSWVTITTRQVQLAHQAAPAGRAGAPALTHRGHRWPVHAKIQAWGWKPDCEAIWQTLLHAAREGARQVVDAQRIDLHLLSQSMPAARNSP